MKKLIITTLGALLLSIFTYLGWYVGYQNGFIKGKLGTGIGSKDMMRLYFHESEKEKELKEYLLADLYLDIPSLYQTSESLFPWLILDKNNKKRVICELTSASSTYLNFLKELPPITPSYEYATYTKGQESQFFTIHNGQHITTEEYEKIAEKEFVDLLNKINKTYTEAETVEQGGVADP